MNSEHVHIDPEAPLSQAVADGKAAREAAIRPEHPNNRFADCGDASELMHQVVGAASMCWENVRAAGVFDDALAREVAAEALDQLSVIVRKAGLR